jgi:type II secretory pathway pseudopilin PulG
MLTRTLTRALTRVRILNAPEDHDTGISLVELLVAMALSVILGAVTMTLFVQISSAANDTTDRAIHSSQARSTLQAWGSYLQVADDPSASGTGVSRFEWFTSSSVLFYSDLHNRDGSLATTNAPTMIWLRLDAAGQLVEERFPATPSSYPASPVVCRIVGFKVTATKLFTPYDALGHDLTPTDPNSTSFGTSPAVGSGCQPLPSAPPSKVNKPDTSVIANLEGISSVTISFTAWDARNAHPLSFISSLSLPIVAGV